MYVPPKMGTLLSTYWVKKNRRVFSVGVPGIGLHTWRKYDMEGRSTPLKMSENRSVRTIGPGSGKFHFRDDTQLPVI